jgi:hypothetical protein
LTLLTGGPLGEGSQQRKIVTAGMVADANPEELIKGGYVREVFVAEQQPG